MARKRNQLRPVKIQRRFPSAAPGSVMIAAGNTRILCTASISDEPPRWLRDADPPRGWVTAEYNMMPGSTPDRQRRGPNSRATEIQRLIGRSLRAAVDLNKMPGIAVTCDCDVICADGGTRTAAITGAFVALSDAIAAARRDGRITRNPILGPLAAVSVGIIDGKAVLDLDYQLDVRAEVDMNVAMNHRGQFIEVQGTGEAGTFTREQLDDMLDLATRGIRQLIREQRKALKRR
ncbi:MAG: ribonuclease PH [Planctomycetaceae bacterium]|nr:ribonuclease PH [Planctomycetaceae bacterium]